MNKETKIVKIYEKIADKTLSFWCKVKSHHNRKSKEWYTNDIFISNSLKNYYYHSCPIDWEYIWKPRYKSDSIEIIWHPVMIWDVLDWIDKNIKHTEFDIASFIDIKWRISIYKVNLLRNRIDYRKPIEDQSEECIDFIYNLIQDDR